MKEKIINGIKYAWLFIVCLVIALVADAVLDIVLTFVLNKIFDVDTESDWLVMSKKVIRYFKEKLG